MPPLADGGRGEGGMRTSCLAWVSLSLHSTHRPSSSSHWCVLPRKGQFEAKEQRRHSGVAENTLIAPWCKESQPRLGKSRSGSRSQEFTKEHSIRGVRALACESMDRFLSARLPIKLGTWLRTALFIHSAQGQADCLL